MKDFKPFYDRNRLLIGAVGIGVTVVLMFVSVNWKSLPFVDQPGTYSAYFKQAGGLTTDSKVRVSGFEVGQVANVSLDGPRVLVKFKIDRRIRLGDRAEAAIKLSTLLGNKVLEVTPRGATASWTSRFRSSGRRHRTSYPKHSEILRTPSAA